LLGQVILTGWKRRKLSVVGCQLSVVSYDDFSICGKYRITVYAGDSETGTEISLKETWVSQTGGCPKITGDLDGNGRVELIDAILALKVSAGQYKGEVNIDADLGGDGKTGIQPGPPHPV